MANASPSMLKTASRRQPPCPAWKEVEWNKPSTTCPHSPPQDPKPDWTPGRFSRASDILTNGMDNLWKPDIGSVGLGVRSLGSDGAARRWAALELAAGFLCALLFLLSGFAIVIVLLICSHETAG